MQSPPPLPSVLIRLLWMMGCVLYRMGKIMRKFTDFYFSSYRVNFIENLQFLEQKRWKMSITQKIVIGKDWNLVFLINRLPFFLVNLTTYGNIIFFYILMFHAWIFFIKIIKKKFKGGQIYMKDLDSAELKEKPNFKFLDSYFSSYGYFSEKNHPNFRR